MKIARPPKPKREEPSAIALLEEAVHLLRRTPAGDLAVQLGGTMAWALGFLYFWAETSWFAPSDEAIAWHAFGLAGLYGGLKLAQADFASRLLARRMGRAPERRTAAGVWRMARRQLRVQAWGLFVLPVSAVAGVTFGWTYAYYQNVSVLAASDEAGAARVEARRWTRQNHLLLLFLTLLTGAVWVNLASGFYLVPKLANQLLGVDNLFGYSGWWFLNTTFLASVTTLTWLAVDPLVKAVYVLRVFYGQAQQTGADIRVALREAQARPGRRMAVGAGALAAVLLAAAVIAPGARAATAVEAAEGVTTRQAVAPAELDHAINEVLAGQDFQWQLRHKPDEQAEAAENTGPLAKFFREGAKIFRETGRAVWRAWKRVKAWFDGLFPRKADPVGPEASGGGDGMRGFVQMLLYGLLGILVVLLGWVVFQMVRQTRNANGPTVAARVVTEARPDLRDENTQAAQLPAEGWLGLAREQMAAGEWRLAWRALYLATLAQLAAEGLLLLAKFKTNLDYEREVRRRAVVRGEVAARFARRRRMFEDVWYGDAVASADEARRWLEEFGGGTAT